MKLELFSIFDANNGLFDPPMSAINSHDFTRNLALMCENKETRYFKYREDLSVYHVGSFDTVTGEVIHITPAIKVCSMLDLVKPEAPFDKKAFIDELKLVLGIK